MRLGSGRYETLLHTGDRDCCPMLTFTTPWNAADVPDVAPSLDYLRMLADRLIAARITGASNCPPTIRPD